jgi:hypothetical protein
MATLEIWAKLPWVAISLIGALAVLGALGLLGVPISLKGSQDSEKPLKEADTPPIEFAYLDAVRAVAYLGEDVGGLSSSEQRSEHVTDSINASLSVGGAGQVGGSREKQLGTVATITPQAADRFYTLLRRLRDNGEAEYGKRCNGERSKYWLGEVNDEDSPKTVMNEVGCIGVGNFVRIKNAQLFLPPFAQALPRVQTVKAFFGALPADRGEITSPTQSLKITEALKGYKELVGSSARMPFVAAPYGAVNQVGSGVTFFLPAIYKGITLEPSLLTGSVTIVGEIVYSASLGAKTQYIDYPTVYTFGRALLQAKPALRADLGVCSEEPPAATRAHPRRPTVPTGPTRARRKRSAASRRRAGAGCLSAQRTLHDIRKSVTFRPPFVVVLPIAIYE